jgi:hypothetical protein
MPRDPQDLAGLRMSIEHIDESGSRSDGSLLTSFLSSAIVGSISVVLRRSSREADASRDRRNRIWETTA